MRIKPQYVMIAVVVVLMGVGLFFVSNSNLPGTREQVGAVVTKSISTAEPTAAASFTIALKEGGDAAHEADHIFEALQNEAVASASLNTETLELEVRFDGARAAEPDIRKLLVASGYLKPEAADAVAAELSADGTSQELNIEVGEQLDPALIRAKAGVPLKLIFGPGTGHLASISIAELGVRQDLSNGATVEIADPAAGTYGIVCAEGVADGTLIVE